MVLNAFSMCFSCFFCLLERHNGRRIFVSIAENMLEAKSIEKGVVVTVKHKGTNVHGTLQNPKFYRERKDFEWKDLEL